MWSSSISSWRSLILAVNRGSQGWRASDESEVSSASNIRVHLILMQCPTSLQYLLVSRQWRSQSVSFQILIKFQLHAEVMFSR